MPTGIYQHKPHSEITKIKLSIAKLGNKNPSKRLDVRLKMSERTLGEKNHFWKGGIKKTTQGYKEIYMPEHPFAQKGKYIREHRYMAEAILGRFLQPSEVIHHIDENKENNLSENLYYFRNSKAHQRFHEFLKRHNLNHKILSSNLGFYAI